VLDILSVSNIINHRTLIIGEVCSGKTALTAEIVRKLIRKGLAHEITIIDMAPQKIFNVGGKLIEYLNDHVSKVRYLTTEIKPPRILSSSEEEALKYAQMNSKKLKPLLKEFLENPTKILVINDLSIYVHAGPYEDVDACIMAAKTFIANSYYGKEINGKFPKIGFREKKYILDLIKYVDNLVVLKKKKGC